MSGLPREGPGGRIGDPDPAPPAGTDTGESLLLVAAAVSAAGTLVQLGWQTDRLVRSLDGATGNLRTILVSNYVIDLWVALLGLAAALAVVALRRSPRWAGAAWGGLLALTALRLVSALPTLSARLSLDVSLDPPTWLEITLLVCALVTGALAIAARPRVDEG